MLPTPDIYWVQDGSCWTQVTSGWATRGRCKWEAAVPYTLKQGLEFSKILNNLSQWKLSYYWLKLKLRLKYFRDLRPKVRLAIKSVDDSLKGWLLPGLCARGLSLRLRYLTTLLEGKAIGSSKYHHGRVECTTIWLTIALWVILNDWRPQLHGNFRPFWGNNIVLEQIILLSAAIYSKKNCERVTELLCLLASFVKYVGQAQYWLTYVSSCRRAWNIFRSKLTLFCIRYFFGVRSKEYDIGHHLYFISLYLIWLLVLITTIVISYNYVLFSYY